MPMSNQSSFSPLRLSYYERQKIEYYLRLRIAKRQIAKRLKRDPSVIIREVNRNSLPDGRYLADFAQVKADKQAKKTNKRKLDKDDDLRRYVENKLEYGWSPEQIAGRTKERPPACLKGLTISHESIYDYIYNGWGKYLFRYLRRAKKQRQKRYSRKKHQENSIKDRVSIHDRPKEVDLKERYGDWESDLILFKKQSAAVSVQYERKSMLAKLHKTNDKTALENQQALIQTLEEMPGQFKQSLTFDNGLENICHKEIRDQFLIHTYFCDPYSSWQKGGVENLNGLIRQYLPKNADVSKLTDDGLREIEELLNNRPRKSLNYQTPNEIYQQVCQLNNQVSDALNP